MSIERKEMLNEDGGNDEREKELETLREKARADELARVRAEAALEESRRRSTEVPQTPNQAQAWTEEQWQQAEAQSGMSRQQLMTANALAMDASTKAAKALEDRIKAAEERAARAEERASRFEQSAGVERQVSKFLDGKPALRSYKDDVDAYVNKFPESDRKDPAKLKEILSDAEIYVRGKVGAKMRSSGSGSSARLGGGSEFDDSDTPALDLSGLDNKHERRLVEDLFDEVKDQDDKQYDKFLSSDKTTYRAPNEWDAETANKK